jgi:hypothetical protein
MGIMALSGAIGGHATFLRAVLVLLLAIPLALVWLWFLERHLQKTSRVGPLGRALSKFGDTRAIGPILMAWPFSSSKRHRQEIEAVLVRLLPRLRATDTHLLEDWERGFLHRILTGNFSAGKNTELILAILKAFEQVGDGRDLPTVKKLAAGKGTAAKDARIQEAAQSCLLYLQERLEGGPGQTLLRPADRPDSPEETLLRPARGVSEEDAPRLLRPVEPEEEADAAGNKVVR